MRNAIDASTPLSPGSIRAFILGTVLAVSLTAFSGIAGAHSLHRPNDRHATLVSKTRHIPAAERKAAERHVVHHETRKVAEHHVVRHETRRVAEHHVVRHETRKVAEHHVVRHETRPVAELRRTAEERRIRKIGGGLKFRKESKAKLFAAYHRDVLQCVPFARAASGIELKGNAANWWDAAAGVYQRGSRPQAGAVLNFRANGRIHLGHVAVVRKVINSREIEVDQANWAWSRKGNISYGVPVIDVSPHNDWTAVRVALGPHSDAFGSVYGTYGFIYDRPDSGMMVANAHRPSGAPSRSLRSYAEVAEAPRHLREHRAYDAPARSLR